MMVMRNRVKSEDETEKEKSDDDELGKEDE